MGFFANRYTKPGPGIEKDGPPKKGLLLFFDIFLREFSELFKLNLLFILFCVPVVTIPAALTAMSRVTLSMVQDRNHYLWTDFIKAFKADFTKSLLAGILLFAGAVCAVLSIYFYSQAARINAFFYLPLGFSFCIAFIFAVMSFYIFPMIALVELPLKLILKNAFFLTFLCFGHNIAAFAAIGVLLVLYIGLLPLSLPFALVLFFSLMNLIAVFCSYAGMKRYVIRENK